MLSDSQIREWLEVSKAPTKKTAEGRKLQQELAHTAVPALCEALLLARSSRNKEADNILRELGRLRLHLVEYNTEYDQDTRNTFVRILDKFMDKF